MQNRKIEKNDHFKKINKKTKQQRFKIVNNDNYDKNNNKNDNNKSKNNNNVNNNKKTICISGGRHDN